MKKLHPPKKAKGEFLALMDMVFLLLVLFIFMIVQMRPDFGVSVELPDIGKEVMQSVKEKETTKVTVSLTAEHEYFVNKEPASPESIPEMILQQAEGKPVEEISVIIKADKNATYGDILQLFGILRKQGLKDVLFDVDPSSEGALPPASQG